MAKKEDKKKVMLKGIVLHIAVYILIAFLLKLFKVPGNIIFVIMMVLLWRLLVLSYAFYYEKK